ncbi:MAG: cytochrome c [Anaerolineae bacterium]|nr:cytochrome c [Anaerolineae bacterium]MCO5192470.1 cytochrome c [Anaerolineae bacterium]
MRPANIILALMLAALLVACGGTAADSAPPATPTLEPVAALGQEVFSAECTICHATTPNDTIRGPSLRGVPERAATRVPNTDARSYIYNSILNPGDYVVDGFEDIMLNDFGKKLTGEELDAVVAYLLTLEE